MEVKFKEVNIQYFLSIANATVELDDLGFVKVVGINEDQRDSSRSNGAGKSSVFDAIMWCLTGTTSRGVKKVTTIGENSGTEVNVKLYVDSKLFDITRTQGHNKVGNNLFVKVDGKDMSGKGIRDTEIILSELLPNIDTNLLSSVVILGQGLPNKFSSNTPSGRKDTLEQLCKSDYMIDDLKNRVYVRTQALQHDLRETEDTLLTLKTKRSILAENRLKIESKLEYEKDIEGLRARRSLLLEEYEQLEDNVNKAWVDFQDAYKQRESLQKELAKESTRVSENLSNIDAEYSPRIESASTEVSTLRATLQVKENEVKRIQSIVDVCPTCGQKLVGVEKPSTKQLEQDIAVCKDDLKRAIEVVDGIKGERDAKKQSLREGYKKFQLDNEGTLNNTIKFSEEKSNVYQELQRQKHQVNDEILSIREKIATIEDETSGLREELERIDSQICDIDDHVLYSHNEAENINKRLSILKQFTTYLSRDFRSYLLGNVVDYLDGKLKNYSSYVFDNQDMSMQIDGNSISMSFLGKQYEALSGGEKQKVDIITQLSIRDLMRTYMNFSCNLLVLDEIFDNLDDVGCKKIVDLLSNKLNDVGTMFIISHHDDSLNLPCDKTMVVTKTKDGTSVVSNIL